MTTTPGNETTGETVQDKVYTQPEAPVDVSTVTSGDATGAPDEVVMRHDDGRVTTTSREAFDATWQHLGWSEVTGEDERVAALTEIASGTTSETTTAAAPAAPTAPSDPTLKPPTSTTPSGRTGPTPPSGAPTS